MDRVDNPHRNGPPEPDPRETRAAVARELAKAASALSEASALAADAGMGWLEAGVDAASDELSAVTYRLQLLVLPGEAV